MIGRMPPKIDTEHEKALLSDPAYMPKSKKSGDKWLQEKILEEVSMKGVMVSKGGSDAMVKGWKVWDEVAAAVQAASKARQRQLCDEYRRVLKTWEMEEEERTKKGKGAGRATKKPSLVIVKHEVPAEYCKSTFGHIKSTYSTLAAKAKLSRCAA